MWKRFKAWLNRKTATPSTARASDQFGRAPVTTERLSWWQAKKVKIRALTTWTPDQLVWLRQEILKAVLTAILVAVGITVFKFYTPVPIA